MPTTNGYRQIIWAAAVIGCFSANHAYAAPKFSCSTSQTEITGLSFTPGSMVFRDANGIKYIAGNVIIPESEAISATFRTKIINQVARLNNFFSDFENSSISPVLTKPDRYGRLVVNVFAGADQRWLQLELVRKGLVTVNPQGEDMNCIDELLVAEATARSKKVGIWQIPEIAMLSDDVNWNKRVQSYQLVEGNILSVGKTNSRFYLNFGDNWNEDFTVIVAKSNFKRFKKAYGDLKQLAGKKVRIRGWMIQNRGPMIEMYHPGQIEIDIK